MKIYLSYRRADSQYVVGRIRDRLLAAFGENSVFTDVMDIPVGKDFREVLNKAVKECDVMLVVIGPAWASLTNAQGNKRLFEPDDYIRTEIETGLHSKEALVIPVLVMNASMPPTSELPESLKDLAFRNAIAIRNDPDFDNDMQRLIRQIGQFERPERDSNRANVAIGKKKTKVSPDQGVSVSSQGKTVEASTSQPTFDEAVENAQYYLAYAGSKGGEDIDEQTVAAITKVRQLRDANKEVDAKTEANFWLAYQKLVQQVGVVTTNPPPTRQGKRNPSKKSSSRNVEQSESKMEAAYLGNTPAEVEGNEDYELKDFSTTSSTSSPLEDESIEVETLYKGKPVARSTIKLDGDTTITVPMKTIEDGSQVPDTFLFEVHQKNVDAAIAKRVEEISKQLPDLENVNKAGMQAAIEANLLVNNRSQAVFNDQARGDDQLGIKNEVEALAETLLLRDVEPPVAVGVMGSWGSGKSFVMYLISRYLEETRAKPVKKGWLEPGKDKDDDIPTYVGHIYQISFNAWTYAKSNLWASLMDTIFSCLNRQMQLERLFAYESLAQAEKLPTSVEVQDRITAGGDIFKKIYLEDYQIDLDPDLSSEQKSRLKFWSDKLLSHNLLWQVMRTQNEQALEKIQEDEKELEKDKARRDALDQARHTEKVSTEVLDDKIAEPAYFALLRETLFGFVTDAVSKTVLEDLKKEEIDKDKLIALEKEAEDLVKGTRGLINAFRQNKYYWIAALSIASVTFALPYIWAWFGKPMISHLITRSIAIVTTIVPLLPTLLARWRKIVDFEAETKKAFEKGYEAQQSRRAEEIASENCAFEEKVKKLEEEIKNGSLPACDVLIRLKENRIEQQRIKIGPAAKYSNLLEFVQSRLDAATYETQLGLMHQVRRDIDELTYSLVNSANKDMFPRGKPRVILYIDDLDRCPPSRVVEILEAVQLLLNTKLFIVILGLDTRYVTRALEKEYKEILQHEGDPSGLDYIEKIIQIPYRVRPIERDNLRNYLAIQMDVEKPLEPDTPPAPPVQDQPVSNIPSTQAPSPVDQAKQETAEPQPVVAPKAEEPKPPKIELPAAVVQFKQEDLVDLTACCQQIALTPRSIKRLVNVFKLMKIFWFRADKEAGLAERDRPRPVKQAAICLLALSSAYPEVMREVFVHLEGLYRQGQEQTPLFTALSTIKMPPGSANELAWQLQRYKSDISALKTIAGKEQDGLSELTLKDFKLSTFNLIRSFSFVGDPVYWTGEEEDTSRVNGKSPAKATKTKSVKKQSL